MKMSKDKLEEYKLDVGWMKTFAVEITHDLLEAHAILDKLPVLGCGVRAYVGMTVWFVDLTNAMVMEILWRHSTYEEGSTLWVAEDGKEPITPADPACAYSTRALAEAADSQPPTTLRWTRKGCRND